MTFSSSPGEFPSWDDLYAKNSVESMPWYSANLDPDVYSELDESDHRGRFLDIGTGPGTQAIALSKMGFSVTGSDLSENAIKKASLLGGSVRFVVDDILNTKLEKRSFDYILDRGCFHVLSPEDRSTYVKNVSLLLDDSGVLFLKVFSDKEPRQFGPYHFSEIDIHKLFSTHFEIKRIKDSIYHGTLPEPPKTLFAVMARG